MGDTFECWLRGDPITDVLDLGAMLPSCENLRLAMYERRVWHLISAKTPLRRDMQEIVAGTTGNEKNPTAYIDKNNIDADLVGAQVARHGGHGQHKLAMLVQHVEAVLNRGPRVAEAVLEAVVEFSLKK